MSRNSFPELFTGVNFTNISELLFCQNETLRAKKLSFGAKFGVNLSIEETLIDIKKVGEIE